MSIAQYIVFVNVGFSIYRKQAAWKGWFYMVVRIITIIAAVTATGFFTLARFMVHRIFESPPGVGVAF